MYSLILIFLELIREDKNILGQMVAGNSVVKSARNFFMNAIFICHGCSQIF